MHKALVNGYKKGWAKRAKHHNVFAQMYSLLNVFFWEGYLKAVHDITEEVYPHEEKE